MQKETISQTISRADRDHNRDRQIFYHMVYTRPTLKQSLLQRLTKIFTRKQKNQTRDNTGWSYQKLEWIQVTLSLR